MSTNTLTTTNNGDVADQSKWNQFKEALGGNLVPRDFTTGIAGSYEGGLGDETYPWDDSHIRDIQRSLTTVSTGTADLSDNEQMIKTSTLITNTLNQNTYLQKDSFTFSVDQAEMVTIFFSAESVTHTNNNFTELLLAPATAGLVGKLSLDAWSSTDANEANKRTRPNSYLSSVLYATVAASYPVFITGGPVRMSGTFYFAAGTHTVYVVHGMNSQKAVGTVNYNNCAYGARRAV